MIRHGYRFVYAITPSDTQNLPPPGCEAIYVGGAGDVTVVVNGLASGLATVTYKAVPVGTYLWVKAVQVKATGTTATNLVGHTGQ